MDLKVEVDEKENGGCVVKARSSSAGVAPLLLPPPFGVIASVATFWVPYPDHERNEHRLDRLRGMLPTVQRVHVMVNGTYLTAFFASFVDLWHESVSHVTHQGNTGYPSFRHRIFLHVVAVPVSTCLLVTWLATAFVFMALMLMVPVERLFGYDFRDQFGKCLIGLMQKWVPATLISATAKFHRTRQSWTSPVLATDVFKKMLTAMRERKEGGQKKAPEYTSENKTEIVESGASDMERRKQKILEMQLKRRAEQQAARQAKGKEYAERAELHRQAKTEKARKIAEKKARRDVVFQEYLRKQAVRLCQNPDSLLVPRVKTGRRVEDGPCRFMPAVLRHELLLLSPPLRWEPAGGHLAAMPKTPKMSRFFPCTITALPHRLRGMDILQTDDNFRLLVIPLELLRWITSAIQIAVRNSSTMVFKKPSPKSNRLTIYNSIRDCCLPGIINEDVQRKVLDALARHPGSHFLVLFRDYAHCEYRGLYCYDSNSNEAFKISGRGPPRIEDTMTEKMFTYNSGSKKFEVNPAVDAMSVQIDGFTIQSALWYGKKTTGLKAPLKIF